MSSAPSIRSTTRFPLLALSLGHGCADVCSGALWALLPFLVVERHYSYAAVGVFALVASVASALLQPVLGAHGDRRGGFWLMPAGLALAGLGIGVVGIAPSYPLTLAAVAVCSGGVAAYHPEGARWARLVSSGRVNSDMGVFSLGGGVGYALGPLLVAATLVPLGLCGTLVIPLVPLAAVAVLLVALRRFHCRSPVRAEQHALLTTRGSQWRPFTRLLLLCCVANGVTMGLLTYVPLFLVGERATSPGASNFMTSVLLAAAAVGTLIGGLAAQRFGRRLALVVPQLVLVPLVALLPVLSYGAMVLVVALIGLTMNAYMSISLVLAQEYLPARMGLATGLTIGLSSGAGGLVVAALGVLADRTSPATALVAIAALPLLVAALGAALPQPLAASRAPHAGLQAEAEG